MDDDDPGRAVGPTVDRMGRLLTRPPRPAHAADVATAAPLVVPPPPAAPRSGGTSWITYAFPAVGAVGALVFVLRRPEPLFVLGGLIFAVVMVGVGLGVALTARSGARREKLTGRVAYLAALDVVRAEARAVAQEQVDDLDARHPPPDALWQVASAGDRLWERRRGDADALVLRVGRGRVPLRRPVVGGPSDAPDAREDEVCAASADRLLDAVTTLRDAPLVLDLRDVRTVAVSGASEVAVALVRAVLAQALVWHAPQDVAVAAVAAPDRLDRWRWLKWSPHVASASVRDALGGARLVVDDPDALVGLLAGGRTPPRHLVVVDGTRRPAPDPRAVQLVLADGPAGEPEDADVRLRVDAGGGLVVVVHGGGRSTRSGRADGLGVAAAETLARRLAPWRLTDDDTVEEVRAATRALGFDPRDVDPSRDWTPRGDERLVVRLGLDPDGDPVELDLKETARGGSGPHGLLVGATGSGKSELLRTLVLTLAVQHAPDDLALVLVDYKGGATFAGLGALPHVAGSLTNLEGDDALLGRFHDALRGEMMRRQQVLADAGGLVSREEHERLRASGRSDLEPLPTLLVVVDEFSELLAAERDLVDLFNQLGRVGRSIGVHLLFASQRLEEGKLRGLDSHLSYRVGLRTFTSGDSRTVLGVPDAVDLPPVPGAGYLQVQGGALRRFSAGYVSGPLRAARDTSDGPTTTTGRVLPFVVARLGDDPAGSRPSQDVRADDAAPDEETVLSATVARLAAASGRVRQVWQPPLGEPVGLDQVLAGASPETRSGGAPVLALGLVDRPARQRVDVWELDLTGRNAAVVGGPRSGRSWFLRTLALSAATTRSPEQLQLVVLDLGGQLGALDHLPHTRTVAGRLEPELLRRAVEHLSRLLDEREAAARRLGVDSAATLRRRRDAGELPDGVEAADVVVLVDGWGVMRRDFEELEAALTDVAARGLAYGVHVVATAARWHDFRPQVKDAFGERVELRLSDPGDSEVDRAAARRVPAGAPGRGVADGGAAVQVALARTDGSTDVDTAGERLAEEVDALARRWQHVRAPRVRLLPTQVRRDELRGAGVGSGGSGLLLGLGERDLQPVTVDLMGEQPHLLVLGETGSGRTEVLRTLLADLVERCSPQEARVVVVDPRRGLLGAVPDSHLLAYAGSTASLPEVVEDLARAARARLPGADVTQRQLRDRSWWSGPSVLLVVDDHDLVVTPTSNPLVGLVDLLAQSRDVGLSVLLARRTGGASRALFEPVLQRLTDLAAPGLLLSGDPAEGRLVGGQKPPGDQPPGRGLLVRRGRRPELVQVAQTG